ncbi:hypothetical protein VCRA2119O48_20178 [Vibrio crassostreae]|nr:hypothetical protein VCRA2119O48_20178 [Vibrio crassostreae]CAK2568935.1 hypothetical protein VCRA2122O10_100059 [Vibrio crassostreae]CAK3198805.1 hypothetical protein VCRA2120O9_130107 [Vibrio crassostreae]CAK3346309.1 hypothetical protein VCRA2122O339_200065 [Vibrio crassostreae]
MKIGEATRPETLEKENSIAISVYLISIYTSILCFSISLILKLLNHSIIRIVYFLWL